MEEKTSDSLELEPGYTNHSPFGIRDLDNMLPSSTNGQFGSNIPDANVNQQGIPPQDPVAIIGESGTSKSILSQAFLSQAVRAEDGGAPIGCAILLTTHMLDRASLSKRLCAHLSGEADLTAAQSDNVFCRRLEIHHLSPSILVHMVRQLVRNAQDKILKGDINSDTNRRNQGWRIRFVIDNWSTLRSTHPEIAQDARILEFILFFLRKEGIPTIVVASENAGFANGFQLSRAREVKDQTRFHIYTWHVPFFGENRIATKVSPPTQYQGSSAPIREVRPVGSAPVPEGESRTIRISLDFEQYRGLESGNPEYIPTKLLLFRRPGRSMEYANDIGRLFARLLGTTKDEVLSIADMDTYDDLRSTVEIQGTSPVGYTSILEVDEYWAKSSSNPSPLKSQKSYLEANTTLREGASNRTEDPFGLFAPNTRTDRVARRLDQYNTIGYDIEEHIKQHPNSVVKVPYLWDFGFIAMSSKAASWLLREESRLPAQAQTIRDLAEGKPTSWRSFISACVAASLGFRHPAHCAPLPLALPPCGPDEHLPCLVLEVWATEIDNDMKPSLSRRDSKAEVSLLSMLTDYRKQLFQACYTLKAALPSSLFDDHKRTLAVRDANSVSIASRSWYSTLPLPGGQQSESPYGELTLLPLPGKWSVRGDWFLAMTRRSRSFRMGERVTDILCSKRGSIIRLQEGIGLPTRSCEDPAAAELWTPFKQVHRDALWNPSDSNPEQVRVHYKDLREIGAAGPDKLGLDGLNWLWRSRIIGYERHSRIWRRWICSLFSEWEDFHCPLNDMRKKSPDTPWSKNKPRMADYESAFNSSLDALLMTLSRVSIEG